MTRTHLTVQALIVLTMVTFVSWPQFRPLRAQSVWRYAASSVLEARTIDAARFAGASGPRGPIMGIDAASFTTTMPNPAGTMRNGTMRNGTMYYAAVAAVGGKSSALLGTARTSLNAPIPYARVVVRNIRTGLVFARAVANEQGQFSFLDLDASAYIVELLGPDGSVVAASPMVSVALGDVRTTEVRVAAAASAVRASLSDALAPTLTQVTTVATGNDVTRTTSTQTTQESPR